ncbi:MAG: type IV-A pilus assembly ATPase PilB [Proteobacteria bacterium]|nr:type IV-A pilus assembly ATPase PilB [Pseudomonadota bacterium]
MIQHKPNVMLNGTLKRLIAASIISQEDAIDAVVTSKQRKVSLFTYLVENDIASSEALANISSQEYGVSLFDASVMDIKMMPLSLVAEKLIQKHNVLPLFQRGKKLFLAIADPTNATAIEEIKFHTNMAIEPIVVPYDILLATIDDALSEADSMIDDEDEDGLADLDYEDADDTIEDASDDSSEADNTPIVKFVNKVLLDAIKRGASDIHFEPYEKIYRVRYRIDGMLKTMVKPPVAMTRKVSSRIKVMSRLDIAERRVPQDGRIKLNLSKTKSIDFRVSTCPTLFGEKIVMRILDASTAKMGIDMLGYEPEQKELFVNAIHKPYGMVLVTGPTGSGKTVSLYTALNILNVDGSNISTVEDPVEIRVAGINQVQQNARQGMTFSTALRSFLRQDPDIIMVGEIRDLETAEIAIKAAQTGHMVLSTLHTNSAPETISRLMNMGIAPFNIVSAISLVIAQRLGRRLHSCKQVIEIPDEALLKEGFTDADIKDIAIYDAIGCRKCTQGYKGRVGIYQVMPMSENIKRTILANGNSLEIADQAIQDNIPDLRQSALLKVKHGITSLAEANRITVD